MERTEPARGATPIDPDEQRGLKFIRPNVVPRGEVNPYKAERLGSVLERGGSLCYSIAVKEDFPSVFEIGLFQKGSDR